MKISSTVNGKSRVFRMKEKEEGRNLCLQTQTPIYAGSRLPGNSRLSRLCQHCSDRSQDTDAANLIPGTTTGLYDHIFSSLPGAEATQTKVHIACTRSAVGDAKQVLSRASKSEISSTRRPNVTSSFCFLRVRAARL